MHRNSPAPTLTPTVERRPSRRAKILQVTSYPPPRAGWGVRVEYLKGLLEAEGHQCVVLNIGTSRRIPSTEYETVLGPWDYLKKVVRFTSQGFTAHIHVNGASEKGLLLSFIAGFVNLAFGRRPFLTFHAGIEQVLFPRQKAPRWAPVFALLFKIPRAIICNSEDVKSRIVEYGIDPSKIIPIPAFSTQYLEQTRGDLPPSLAQFYAAFPHVIFCYLRFRPLFYPVELVRGFALAAAERPDVGLVLCGASGHMEGDLWPRALEEIERHGLKDRVLVVDDLDHTDFLAALGKASIYLRSHVSDGVCSSLMEALSLGVPVVASENNTRPEGVIVYPAADPDFLGATLSATLARRAEISASLIKPVATDTLRLEVDLLTGQK
jgi:glycosyltransferase involved in cell wall biosynthesis